MHLHPFWVRRRETHLNHSTQSSCFNMLHGPSKILLSVRPWHSMFRCIAIPRLILTASLAARTHRRRPLTTLSNTAFVLSSPSSIESSALSVASTNMQPSRPLQYQRSVHLDLTTFSGQVAKAEETRQTAYDLSRALQADIVKARSSLETEEQSVAAASLARLTQLFQDSLPSHADRTPREANLSNRMEDYVRLLAYDFFLQSARLLPPSHCPFATDEEYLAACMGLAADLSHYGMGRATARDVSSVEMARDLVQELMDELLEFDFRNGPLRRKYDGTKYSLRALETLLYELSVTGSVLLDTKQEPEKEPHIKKLRMEGLLPKEELAALRHRMEHRDELRETLIKKCRDGQKAAKQSIFALHRGDRKKAVQLMEQCESCIANELLPIVQEEPPLKYGSFSNVLEEYAEAKMFYVWLFGKNDGQESPEGVMLLPDEFMIQLDHSEYLGGLCDLTGEVGRYAVQRGTARDTDGVKLCLSTNGSILNALQSTLRLPGNIGKKMDALRRSVEKLERMLYEISLSEATGRNVKTDMATNEVDGGKGNEEI